MTPDDPAPTAGDTEPRGAGARSTGDRGTGLPDTRAEPTPTPLGDLLGTVAERFDSLTERIETNRVGQAIISVVMVVLIVSVVAWNMPSGKPHDRVNKVTGPITQALGLEQDWALFAPEPRSFSVGVYAEVTFRDGRTVRWTPPHNGLVFSPYRNYRWQKYVERLRADDYSGLWKPTAVWIAGQYGRDVAQVVLVRTFRDVVSPGDGTARPATGRYAFYTLTVR